MNDTNQYGKPSFEPDEGYWEDLEHRLMAIPTESESDSAVRPIRRYRWWAAAAVIALLASIVPFATSNEAEALTAEEIALYIENEGAWMMEDLAFYEEVQQTKFNSDESKGSDDYDLLYLEGVDDYLYYLETDI